MAVLWFMSQNLRGLKGSKFPRWGLYLNPYKQHSYKALYSVKSKKKKSVFNEVTPLPTTESSLVLRPAFNHFYKHTKSKFPNAFPLFLK